MIKETYVYIVESSVPLDISASPNDRISIYPAGYGEIITHNDIERENYMNHKVKIHKARNGETVFVPVPIQVDLNGYPLK